MELSVRGDVWQKDSCKSEREGFQDGSETCCDVWFGDGGADRKTGGRAGGEWPGWTRLEKTGVRQTVWTSAEERVDILDKA